MNPNWNYRSFIARRLFKGKLKDRKLSNIAVRLAITGIILGTAIMLVSISIVIGYKTEVWEKVTGFGSHINIESFDSAHSNESAPIKRGDRWTDILVESDNIESVTAYANKATIINHNEDIYGAVVKGVDSNFDWSFFKKSLVDGEVPIYSDSIKSNSIIISKLIANKLSINVDDNINLTFIDEERATPRLRRFKVSGIYSTSLQEFDELIIIADIRHIIKLNSWDSDMIGGYEVKLLSLEDEDIDNSIELIIATMSDIRSDDYQPLRVVDIRRKYAHIFDWLEMIDMNIWIILSLVLSVTGFSMISAILIIILEHTSFIGVLKALGQNNRDIRITFLNLALYFTGRGILYGNIIGLSIMFAQKWFGIIKLNPEDYNLTTLPIDINIYNILLLNGSSLILIVSALIIPTIYISTIEPAKSIKFD